MKRLLLFLLISLSCQVKAPAQSTLFQQKFTYQTLSPFHKLLFDNFVAYEWPEGKSIGEVLTNTTSLRSKTRLAEGLLFRNKPGDKEAAADILRWILSHQYREKGTPIYGIWKTSVDGDKHDQNWREFIGCDLVLIRKYYSRLLPEALLKDIDTGLMHAALGAKLRNVGPDYTNIAMMSAFLMEHVGTQLNDTELKQAGLSKANAIYALYQQHKTFSEFNSPTYYGVTLAGIALWRELAASEDMRSMGRTLEEAFWHEAVTFYNPALKNMPGPYFRGYGMDMQRYTSIMGLWIAIALNNEAASPLPIPIKSPKYGEMSNIAPIYVLGLSIPKSDLAALQTFTGPRFLERSVPNNYKGDPLKRVTAMINHDWMMGGVSGMRRKWDQIKTGTIHWKAKNGKTGWLIVPGDGMTNVAVNQTAMQIFQGDTQARRLDLLVYDPEATTDSFSGDQWSFPTIRLGVQTDLKLISKERVDAKAGQEDYALAEPYTNLIKISYEIPVDRDLSKPLLSITPTP